MNTTSQVFARCGEIDPVHTEKNISHCMKPTNLSQLTRGWTTQQSLRVPCFIGEDGDCDPSRSIESAEQQDLLLPLCCGEVDAFFQPVRAGARQGDGQHIPAVTPPAMTMKNHHRRDSSRWHFELHVRTNPNLNHARYWKFSTLLADFDP